MTGSVLLTILAFLTAGAGAIVGLFLWDDALVAAGAFVLAVLLQFLALHLKRNSGE